MAQIIAAIYAVSENGIIGKNNGLPWHLPKDFRFFKQTTLGYPIIMGRKSFESLGKALAGRRNIVISRNKNFQAPACELAHSLEGALELCAHEPLVFITGGAGLYKESIEKGYVSLIYETLVHADVEGDVYFQLSNRDQWKIVESEAYPTDDKHEYAFTIRKWVRRGQKL